MSVMVTWGVLFEVRLEFLHYLEELENSKLPPVEGINCRAYSQKR